MSEPMLKVENICAGYGAIEAIKGVSLSVHPGEMVSLIGANGAGKSTSLLCISGVHRIRTGAIYFEGRRIDQLPAHQIVGLGLVQVPEGRRIFPRLSVFENLQMGAYLRRDKAGIQRDLQWVYELFPILADRKGQAGGTLSGGEQQMLAMGRAIMSKPRLLLMDEPSMGISPLLTQKIFDTIKTLNQQGMTILLVEQNAHLALKLSTRGYVLETGQIVLEGPAEQLLTDPGVRKAYLGE
jgi:branched-chain amino acid transport system ATP-binding protein